MQTGGQGCFWIMYESVVCAEVCMQQMDISIDLIAPCFLIPESYERGSTLDKAAAPLPHGANFNENCDRLKGGPENQRKIFLR